MEQPIFVMPEEQRLEALKLEPTPPQPALAERQPIRVEFFDNGPKPGRGRTRYGLVVDVNNSKDRYNINFGVQNYDKLWAYKEGAKASVEEYRTLQAMHSRYYGNALDKRDDVFLAIAKRNGQSGTGTYDFRSGHRDLYFRIGVVMMLNPQYAPWVVLYVDGEEIVVPNDWTATPHSSHPSKKYEVRF